MFGLFAGTIYHLFQGGSQQVKAKPLLGMLLAILMFFIAKMLWTVLFGQDQLAANQVASHSLFGLVAGFGEVRDNFLAFLLPVYVYVNKKSYDFRLMGWPIVIAVSFILVRAILLIAKTGQVWSDNADFRFLNAHEAMMLTFLSFLLFFIRVPGLSRNWSRALACLTLGIGIVANHRSQWVGTGLGILVLLLVSAFGRPMFGSPGRNRVVVSGFLLLVLCLGTMLPWIVQVTRDVPLVSTIAVRLYAVTEPSKDADAKWRQRLWADRISQVGNDWPWGRLLGDRRGTMIQGEMLFVPDHSAYVATYELGGVILCVLLGLFWLRSVMVALGELATNTRTADLWPPAVALAICAAALGFGSAYDFPILAPSFVVMLLAAGRTAAPTYSRERLQHSATSLRTAVHV
jgi:hypothetical protein